MKKSENAAEYWKPIVNLPVQNTDGLVPDVKTVTRARSVISLEGKLVLNRITNQNVKEFNIRKLFLKIRRIELPVQKCVGRRLSGTQE